MIYGDTLKVCLSCLLPGSDLRETLKVCLSGLLAGSDLRGHSKGMSELPSAR